MTRRSSFKKSAAGAGLLLVALIVGAPAGFSSQELFPQPPDDATRVYYQGAENKLEALPFEAAVNLVNVFLPAQQDRVLRLRINGRTATTVLTNNNLKFYVFVADRMDPPPHQLVRLTSKEARRELVISLTRGRKGYGAFERDNIGLERRLLERLQVQASRNRILFVNYIQLRPVKALEPGEYAIIGDSLADIATFRIQ